MDAWIKKGGYREEVEAKGERKMKLEKEEITEEMYERREERKDGKKERRK